MRKVRDHYFMRAKREGYLARSVYKLQEADSRFRFLRPGGVVVDLGAAPGSWTQFAASRVGERGLVVAVDLHEVKAGGPRVRVVKEDCFQVTPQRLRELVAREGLPGVDVVLSDMAPRTSGNRSRDHLRSMALAERGLELALALLGPRGVFFCKVFQGSEFDPFLRRCRGVFETVRVFKPKSSRKESVETFLFCRALRRSDHDAV